MTRKTRVIAGAAASQLGMGGTPSEQGRVRKGRFLWIAECLWPR